MPHSMQWLGCHDPVSLPDTYQAGRGGVVAARHQLPVEGRWSEAASQQQQALIEARNGHALYCAVVGRLLVPADGSKGKPGPTVLPGLPGSEEALALTRFRALPDKYQVINASTSIGCLGYLMPPPRGRAPISA